MFTVKHLKVAAAGVAIAGLLLFAGLALAAAPSPDAQPGAALAPVATPTPGVEDDQRIIQGDQVVSGGNFVLHSGDSLRGDLTVFGGNATLEETSRVEGNVTVFGGNADVYGTVTRDLTVVGGSAHLRSTARIEGKQTTLGGSVIRDPGSVVSGQSTRSTVTPFNRVFPWNPSSPFRFFFDMVGNVVSAIAGAILLTLLAIAVVALFPTNVARIAETVQQQWLVSGSVGVLTIIIGPIIMVLLSITICLIPAAVVLFIGWLLAMLGGWAVTARMLGERLAIGFKTTHWTVIAQTALGAVVLALVGALPLIGWIIALLATALGLGALILTFAGTRPYPAPHTGLTQLPSA